MPIQFKTVEILVLWPKIRVLLQEELNLNNGKVGSSDVETMICCVIRRFINHLCTQNARLEYHSSLAWKIVRDCITRVSAPVNGLLRDDGHFTVIACRGVSRTPLGSADALYLKHGGYIFVSFYDIYFVPLKVKSGVEATRAKGL